MEDRIIIYSSLLFLCFLVLVLLSVVGKLITKQASLQEENDRMKGYVASLTSIHEFNHGMFFSLASVLHGFSIPDVDKILIKAMKNYGKNCEEAFVSMKTIVNSRKKNV